MFERDEIWQLALDEERDRWVARPVEELIVLEEYSEHNLKIGNYETQYLLIHEKPDEDARIDNHSFILKTSRDILPFLFMGLVSVNYYSGFSFDDDKKVIPLSEDIIGKYD